MYLGSHLSVADWCRMEVHIFLRASEGGEGSCEISMEYVPQDKIKLRFIESKFEPDG